MNKTARGWLPASKKNGEKQQVTSLNQAFNLPLLPEWKFYSLFKNLKDSNNKQAKDKIILSFYKLICKIASKLKDYSNFSIKEEGGRIKNELQGHLINEGVIGICKALDKADKNSVSRNEVYTASGRMSKYKRFEIVLYIGDAMGDFPKKDFDKFGNNQIILPNPMYGKW